MSVLPVLRPQVIVTIHAPEMSGEDNVKGGTVRAWQGCAAKLGRILWYQLIRTQS